MDKKTPLYDTHVALGGKMVSFGGYCMPVQYPAGVIKEHMAVRENAGIFDVSHMGEVLFEGPDALKNLNYILTNDFTKMSEGRVRYSVMCNEEGGCIDDLVVYKFNDQKYMVVVNAANQDKDASWMEAHVTGDCKFTNISETIGQIALQGPKSKDVLAKIADEEGFPAKYYTFNPDLSVAGVSCIVSQTGYTGEFGYELYMDSDKVVTVWNALLEAGKEFGLLPCGLGARDTLRLEAAMPLYGHEMNDSIDPLETGLAFGVKMQKEDFIGKKAIEAKGESPRTRVGMKVTGRGIVREGEDVFIGDEKIGVTTSGTHCPYLGYAIAMAMVAREHSEIGTQVEVDVRGRRVAAEIVELPFYKRAK